MAVASSSVVASAVPSRRQQGYRIPPRQNFRYAASGYVFKMEGHQGRRGIRHHRRGEDSAVKGGRHQRSRPLTSMILQHILNRYSLFSPTKTFSFLWGLGVVRGGGSVGGWEAIPPPPSPPTTSHTIFRRGGSLSLFFSLFYLSLSFYSLYPFFFYFFILFLSLILTLFSLSTLLLFLPREGARPRG